jgi:hypothetical protein
VRIFEATLPPNRMSFPNLRPRSGVELIDASFQFLRENFALLFTAVAVTYAPIAVLEYEAALDPTNIMLAAIKGLVAWFFSAFAQAAVIRIVAARYMGEDITAADALRAVWSRIGTVLLVTLVYGLIVGIGTILLVVPGIYFAAKYFASMPAAIVEGRATSPAMDRSSALTDGSKMRIVWIFLLTLIVYFLLNMAVVALGAALTSVAFAALIARVTMAVTNPFLFTLVTLVYFDLRIRREGLDLDVLMSSAPPVPAPAPAPASGPVPG